MIYGCHRETAGRVSLVDLRLQRVVGVALGYAQLPQGFAQMALCGLDMRRGVSVALDVLHHNHRHLAERGLRRPQGKIDR